jgi:hypothetical protein
LGTPESETIIQLWDIPKPSSSNHFQLLLETVIRGFIHKNNIRQGVIGGTSGFLCQWLKPDRKFRLVRFAFF